MPFAPYISAVKVFKTFSYFSVSCPVDINEKSLLSRSVFQHLGIGSDLAFSMERGDVVTACEGMES